MARELEGIVVGLDLDGVCADYVGAFARVAAKALGVEPGDLPEKRSWSWEDWGLTHEQWSGLHLEAVNVHRVFRDADLIAGADTAVRCLSDAGASVRVITNRLCNRSDPVTVFSDTARWLDKHEIAYDELCFVNDKTTVAADIYIDDSPHVLERLAAAGCEAIVFDWPYNRDAPGLRVRDWSEALALIMDLGNHRARAAA